MFLSNIIIILSRTSEPGNVGAVCRAMKNMGLSRLRLVAPDFGPGSHARTSREEALIRARAVHAGDIWEQAAVFDTLAGAAADCSLLVGTTRRRGRRRKNVTMDPRSLAAWLGERFSAAGQPSGGKIGLVFGNERTGLEDAELDLCNVASHIPVSGAFPSLNLSHAVQIYAYELFLAFGGDCSAASAAEPSGPDPVKGEWTPLNRIQVEDLTAAITGTLADLGFYKHPGQEEQTRFLRDLVSRAGLTEREGAYLKNIFAKAARLGSIDEGESLSVGQIGAPPP
ncbi:MAG: RNA methyltransferase [Treponema sp.]|jgi:tRNA/rRNA methyltransferase/tRNA (cytidine32/uridine32-2'-O)-methyltransferase|nr:RNA methyltransferase [Treponema sp.]